MGPLIECVRNSLRLYGPFLSVLCEGTMPKIYEGDPCLVLWTPRFCLRHAVRAVVGAGAILISAAIAVACQRRADTRLRVVSVVDAIFLYLAVVTMTLYWDTPVAIESFLTESQGHLLSRTWSRPTPLLAGTTFLFVVQVILFAYVLGSDGILEGSDVNASTLVALQLYVVTALVWHALCAVLFALATLLQWQTAIGPPEASEGLLRESSYPVAHPSGYAEPPSSSIPPGLPYPIPAPSHFGQFSPPPLPSVWGGGGTHGNEVPRRPAAPQFGLRMDVGRSLMAR